MRIFSSISSLINLNLFFSLSICSGMTVGEKLLMLAKDNNHLFQQNIRTWQHIAKLRSRSEIQSREFLERILPLLWGNDSLPQPTLEILVDLLSWRLDLKILTDDGLLGELEKSELFSDIPLGKKLTRLLAKSVEQKRSIFETVAGFLVGSFAYIEANKENYTLDSVCSILTDLDVHQKGVSGATVFLHLLSYPFDDAAHRNRIEKLARKFIANGVSIDDKDTSGTTALHLVATHPFFPTLCESFIAKGAKAMPNNEGNTPLHLSITSFREMRPERSLGVTQVDSTHWPSVKTIRTTTFPVINMCQLFRGCLNIHNNHLDTPLHCVFKSKADYEEVVDIASQMLILGADPNTPNRYGQTFLHLACKENFVESFGRYYDNSVKFDIFLRDECSNLYDNFGNQPIHYACALGVSIDFLKNTGFDISSRNESDWTVLHLACFFKNEDAVRGLIEKCKVDVNAQITMSGKTAFMIACENGCLDICMLLLEQPDFKKGIRDKLVGSALDWACEFAHDSLCVQLLEGGRELGEKRKAK